MKMTLAGQKIALEGMRHEPVEPYLSETPGVPWGRRVYEVAEILTIQVRTPGAGGRKETV